MKIKSFTVNNYRSIVKTNKIEFNDINVLIGKNNEGKSNILKALSVCMQCIKDFRRFKFNVRTSPRNYYNSIYDWNIDFPKNLQGKRIKKNTLFELEISFDNCELSQFNKEMGTRITKNDILLRLEINPNNDVVVSFPIRGTTALTSKFERVLNFLSDKFYYNFIPAIRTEKQALNLIRNNIGIEMESLEENQTYIDCLNRIREIQNEKCKLIANDIKSELQEFIPKVKDVEIILSSDNQKNYRIPDVDVFVDDGVLTNIEYKGDGVKSLAVLAMLKNRKHMLGTSSIIAIDEPEAHIHPGAITELNKKFLTLSNENQVIISTHNQGFVNCINIENNIIVENGEAKPAQSIEEIRKVLGVKISDNLINSRFVLLVEGMSDAKILDSIIRKHSCIISKALDERVFSIEPLNGASHLEYNLSRLKKEICYSFALVDDDQSGNTSIKKALDSNLIDNENARIYKCPDKLEAEIEDCVKIKKYSDIIQNKYSVNIDESKISKNKKWSYNIKKMFDNDGIYYDEEIEKNIKILIADFVKNNIDDDLFYLHRMNVIFSLIGVIEKKLV